MKKCNGYINGFTRNLEKPDEITISVLGFNHLKLRDNVTIILKSDYEETDCECLRYSNVIIGHCVLILGHQFCPKCGRKLNEKESDFEKAIFDHRKTT